MPLVRIDLPRGKLTSHHAAITDVIYEAMSRTLNVPANDRFMLISEHALTEMVIDPQYLGISRSPECLVIQVTLNAGRSTEMKKAFYRAVADGLHERLGQRKEDVVISLVEVAKENWSFGNGEAPYA